LRELEHEFANELVVIGVHSAKFPAERESENVRAAVQRHELHHPVVNDGDFAIWQSYAVRAWPTLMFVDPKGSVFGKHEGEFPIEPVRKLLREAIAEFDAEGAIDRTPLPTTPLPPVGGALRFPGKVLADNVGSRLFIADSGHNRIVACDFEGNVSLVVGSGEPGFEDGEKTEARFDHPQGMALSDDGARLYVADTENHAIREIDLVSGRVTTVGGTGEQGHQRTGGPALQTSISSPWDLTFAGDLLWIAMAGTHQLWTLDLDAGQLAVAAGTGVESIHDGPLLEATFAQSSGITAIDDVLYTADSETSSIRRVDPALDRVRRLVGRGLFDFGDVDARGDSVRLQHPLGVEGGVENEANVVYIADSYNDKIKRLDPATREVVTLFGGDARGSADGEWRAAEFWEPGGLSRAGKRLYIADTNNHAVRTADLERGEVTTITLKNT
jgi:sugar lactone lactonase YvrE